MKDFTVTAGQVFYNRVINDKNEVDWSPELEALGGEDPMKMVKCSQERSLCSSPGFPFNYSEDTLKKRISLMREEMQEFEDAVADRDVTAMFDALVDQMVILQGSILELGFGKMFSRGLQEVCSANYTKAREDGIYNVNGVNTELNPEYPLGKFMKDKRFYQEPNLIKVILTRALTTAQRVMILNNILRQEGILVTSGKVKLLEYKFGESVVGIYIDGLNQSQIDWVNSTCVQLNYINNVCKFDILSPERGYVDADGVTSTNQTK